MHFWPKFGNTDFNWWWLIARTSSKWGKFWLLSSIWPWSSRSIAPRNNRDLNQGLLHLWSKFGDSSLNSWLVIARTSWWLTDRHTHTHTQATTIPEGHNWPRVKMNPWWLLAWSSNNDGQLCCQPIRSHIRIWSSNSGHFKKQNYSETSTYDYSHEPVAQKQPFLSQNHTPTAFWTGVQE